MLKNSSNTSVAYSQQDQGSPQSRPQPPRALPTWGALIGVPKVCGAVAPESRP